MLCVCMCMYVCMYACMRVYMHVCCNVRIDLSEMTVWMRECAAGDMTGCRKFESLLQFVNV
jgi:hypothetical protein